jgi:hypothetical protein
VVPANGVLAKLADGMARCIKLHETKTGASNTLLCMVVQPGEKNSFDQRALEMALWDRHAIATVRLSLKMIEAGDLPRFATRMSQRQIHIKYLTTPSRRRRNIDRPRVAEHLPPPTSHLPPRSTTGGPSTSHLPPPTSTSTTGGPRASHCPVLGCWMLRCSLSRC